MRKNLTKNERIRKKKDLSTVFAQGRKFSSRGAKLIWMSNSYGFSRFAVTLVRKYGNSVQRNKAKRILRELFRNNKFRIKQGYDFIFVLYPDSDEFENRNQQFIYLLKKASLME